MKKKQSKTASKVTHDCEAEDCFVTECLICREHHAPHCEATQTATQELQCSICGTKFDSKERHGCEAPKRLGAEAAMRGLVDEVARLEAENAALRAPAAVEPEGRVYSDEDDVYAAWGKFRRAIRQVLYENGIKSNPGWSDDNVVEGIRQLAARTRPDSAKGDKT